mmetsp:Transcript_61304/g.145974  ORF Transcript_61304/g.145974 Transcript_61304/m.145974 type:complete len:242 (-) Transcript_61304:258-983(-)
MTTENGKNGQSACKEESQHLGQGICIRLVCKECDGLTHSDLHHSWAQALVKSQETFILNDLHGSLHCARVLLGLTNRILRLNPCFHNVYGAADHCTNTTSDPSCCGRQPHLWLLSRQGLLDSSVDGEAHTDSCCLPQATCSQAGIKSGEAMLLNHSPDCPSQTCIPVKSRANVILPQYLQPLSGGCPKECLGESRSYATKEINTGCRSPNYLQTVLALLEGCETNATFASHLHQHCWQSKV